MNIPARTLILALALAIGPAAVVARAQTPAQSSKPAFELLGELVLPTGVKVGNTVVGGLSGLSWDPDRRLWLMISDDKSEHGPGRIYGAEVGIEGGHLASFHIRTTILLRRADGSLFPPPPTGAPKGENGPNSVDGEGVAYASDTKSIFWSSEGNWATGRPPTITEARPDGHMIRMLPTPAFAVTSADRTTGPRDNSDFEALCLSPDKRSLWVGIEFPLLQDDGLPTDTHGSVTRLTRLDRATGAVVAQYAYPVDARPGGQTRPGVADGPGLVECAALPDGRVLTVERVYVPGPGSFIRMYLVDPAGAQDIAALPSLAGASPRPVGKTLALDLNTTGVLMDNLEGMAIGPVLPDGRRLLLMVSDDNFSRAQKTVLVAFALDLAALGPRAPVAP